MEHPYQGPTTNQGSPSPTMFWLRLLIITVIYGILASGPMVLHWFIWSDWSMSDFETFPLHKILLWLLIDAPIAFKVFYFSFGASLSLFAAGIRHDWQHMYKHPFRIQPNASWTLYLPSWIFLLMTLGAMVIVISDYIFAMME